MITDWLDPVSYKLGQAAGGGNPNTVETYSGTTANVMSNVGNLLDLMDDIYVGNATALLTLPNLSNTPMAGTIVQNGLLFGSVFFTDPQETKPAAGAAYFYRPGSVAPVYGKILYQGDWVSMGTTDCTLIIIRHPLP